MVNFMRAKFKIGESVISVGIGNYIRQIGEQLFNQGNPYGALIAAAGWIIMAVNVLIGADGVIELYTIKVFKVKEK